jgi:hypothetical protein
VAGEEAIGSRWRQWLTIDEGGRFGNVRFLLAPEDEEAASLYAWWCTDLAGGDAEFVRYDLSCTGVCDRTVLAAGPADEWWPLETQIALADGDGDGVAEVWFGVKSGAVWRWQPQPHAHRSSADQSTPTAPELVARFPGAIGALAVTRRPANQPQAVYVSVDTDIHRIQPAARR